MEELNFTSYNIRGLNTNIKRKAILGELKKSRTNVAFIQETHLKKGGRHIFNEHWFPHTYNSYAHNTRAKGVAIWISRDTPWVLDEEKNVEEGRSIMGYFYL